MGGSVGHCNASVVGERGSERGVEGGCPTESNSTLGVRVLDVHAVEVDRGRDGLQRYGQLAGERSATEEAVLLGSRGDRLCDECDHDLVGPVDA